MSAEEIQLSRYQKFRRLGMWEEFLVRGGNNVEAREARAAAPGAYTAAGTWAPTPDDAKYIESLADMEEKWAATLAGKEEWLMKPIVPAGSTAPGMIELAAAAVEARRQEQAGGGAKAGANGGAPSLVPADSQ